MRHFKNPLRTLYDWTLRQASKPFAIRILAFVAFAESSFFPIPAEVLLIPMVLAVPANWFVVASVSVLFSVLGGMFGYFIGYVLFESFGQTILAFYHAEQVYADYAAKYNDWGWLIVVLGGFTPIPYKIVTIASGAAQMNFPVFVLCSLLSRGLRMYLVAFLLRLFGVQINDSIQRWFGVLSFLFVAILIAGFFLVAYL